MHGSLLSKSLFDEAKKKSIDLEICGLGGERMKQEGVKILKDTTSISAIGIWEALPLILPTIRIQKKFYKLLKKYPPDCLILIDYMGPNIKIGTKLKKSKTKIPIFYYIAPQEWAWRVGNNSTTNLINFSDKIFAIFKKEAFFYKKRGGNVMWVGHPMIDLTKKTPFKEKCPNYSQPPPRSKHSTFNACIETSRIKIYIAYFHDGGKKITTKISKFSCLYTLM